MFRALEKRRGRSGYPYTEEEDNVTAGVWPNFSTHTARYEPHVNGILKTVSDGEVDYGEEFRVLDVGMGTGDGSERMEDVLSHFLDEPVSMTLVDTNQYLLSEHGDAARGMVQALPLADGSVDAAVSSGLLPFLGHIHPAHQEAGLKELERVVSPDGVVGIDYATDPREDVPAVDGEDAYFNITGRAVMTSAEFTAFREETDGFSSYPLPDRDPGTAPAYTLLHDHETSLTARLASRIQGARSWMTRRSLVRGRK